MRLFVKYIVFIILSGVVIWGGLKYKEYRDFQKEMVKIVHSKEVENLIIDDLKRLDPQALTSTGKIESYAIDDKSIRHNPMGGIMFQVIVNEDNKKNVYYGLCKYGGSEKIDLVGGSRSPSLEALLEVKKD